MSQTLAQHWASIGTANSIKCRHLISNQWCSDAPPPRLPRKHPFHGPVQSTSIIVPNKPGFWGDANELLGSLVRHYSPIPNWHLLPSTPFGDCNFAGVTEVFNLHPISATIGCLFPGEIASPPPGKRGFETQHDPGGGRGRGAWSFFGGVWVCEQVTSAIITLHVPRCVKTNKIISAIIYNI